MPVPVLFAALAVVASVPLLWWAVASGRRPDRAVAANLVRGAVYDARELALSASARERAVQPLVGWLAARTRRFTPIGWIERLDHRLALVGRPAAWPLERVLAAKLFLGIGGFLFGLLLLAGQGSLRSFFVWVTLTVGGYMLPDLLVSSRATQRQRRIEIELPDTLDQMTICVEAGLGFESAMARAARTGDGPLADELGRTLKEVQIGVPRATAMRDLADRSDVADLRRFVLAVVQAEKYGIAIADVLRTQAAELRLKRRQRAEERAMKIPVKIVFPLVLFILPSLFIAIMGPGVIRVMRAFSAF